ncbi:hypothetical protein DRQ17_03050 [bacterium]|nr:MAG: hypothetical protein DRQ17_03050 [bacterium]
MLPIFIILLLAEPVKVKTPRGDVVVNVSGKEKDVSIKDVKNSILDRLEEIEKLLPKPGTEMTHMRRKRLINLLEQIAGLVEFIPSEGVISIGDTLKKNGTIIEGMDDSSFSKLVERLNQEEFSEDKLKILEVAASHNYFYVYQVCKVLEGFTDGEDRLKALRLLWPVVVDRENGFKILSLFEFEDEKSQAEKILKED